MSESTKVCGGIERIKTRPPLDYREQTKRKIVKEQKKKRENK